jgi:Sulfatase-modifying factor enzyme 1/Calcineurin-like phosphoesterase
MRRLRILHISDLHERAEFEGMSASRLKTLKWDARQRGQILGDRFRDVLTEIAAKRIDLVCFTGDLADWGVNSEYKKASERLQSILDLVAVPRSRFFAVPGNHDVKRTVSVDAWIGLRTWLAESNDVTRLGKWLMGAKGPPPGTQEEWIPQVLERTTDFWKWLAEFRGDDLRAHQSEPVGYRATLLPGTLEQIDSPIHIVGLDSAWLCGADVARGDVILKDQGSIIVTEEQVDAHIREGEHGLSGYRVGLIHHPLDHLADHARVRRLLGDNGVDLLMHGHQHEPLSIQTRESGASLRVVAAGCLVEGDLGKNWPNGFQVIEVDPISHAGAIHFHKWSATGRFWAKGSDIYRDAPEGVLPLSAKDLTSGSESYNHKPESLIEASLRNPPVPASRRSLVGPPTVLPTPKWAVAAGSDEYGRWADLVLSEVRQRFRFIPHGQFFMGTTRHEPGRRKLEEPSHPVVLSGGFWLADTACTQALWYAVTRTRPSRYEGLDENPVECVSWNDIVKTFVPELESRLRRTRLGLPTEAEWEYACRAGSPRAYAWGDVLSADEANVELGDSKVLPIGAGQPSAVKRYQANAFGLYEMHGNVWEWCDDAPRTYEATLVTDPHGGYEGRLRTVRGGSWNNNALRARSACRRVVDRSYCRPFIGFRIKLVSG